MTESHAQRTIRHGIAAILSEERLTEDTLRLAYAMLGSLIEGLPFPVTPEDLDAIESASSATPDGPPASQGR